ncbi:hypothetical protein ABZ799_28805 [Nocardiopsis dassonvillei]|uniref:hypothetical protein n=1 Tax=Nocardiopsis dassonvillei TaxID=2014 RepID=UPI00340E6378
MFAFLSACFFGGAYWLDGKLTMKFWGGFIPLLVGLAGSMLLYASPASQTILGWLNNWPIGPLTSWLGGLLGEPLPVSVVYGVVCIAGAVVTGFDLWKDHTYNPVAITALVLTPIAAHGAGDGVLPAFIDMIHSWGAAAVAGVVGGAVGS